MEIYTDVNKVDVLNKLSVSEEELLENYGVSKIEALYDGLAPEYRYQVTEILYNLLSGEKKTGLYGYLLSDAIDYDPEELNGNVTKEERLIKRIYAYYLFNNDMSNDFKTKDEFRQRIKKFLLGKTMPREDNKYFDYACEYYNLSRKAFISGQGKYYELDNEALLSYIEKNDKSNTSKEEKLRSFVGKIVEKEFSILDTDKIEQKQDCMDYVAHNKRVLAKLCAKTLQINVDTILIEKECFITLCAKTFSRLFEKLSQEHQRIIIIYMNNIYLDIANEL